MDQNFEQGTAQENTAPAMAEPEFGYDDPADTKGFGYQSMPAPGPVYPQQGYGYVAPPVYPQNVNYGYVPTPGFVQPQQQSLPPLPALKEYQNIFVPVIGGLALVQLILQLVFMNKKINYVYNGEWGYVVLPVMLCLWFLALVIEAAVTYGTAKKSNDNPVQGGLRVGLVCGVFHLVISFIAATVMFIFTVAIARLSDTFFELLSLLGISGGFTRIGIAGFIIILWVIMILWIMMWFNLNSVRIRLVNRLKGKRPKLATMFPAVLVFLMVIPLVLLAVSNFSRAGNMGVYYSSLYSGMNEARAVYIVDGICSLLMAAIFGLGGWLLIKINKK